MMCVRFSKHKYSYSKLSRIQPRFTVCTVQGQYLLLRKFGILYTLYIATCKCWTSSKVLWQICVSEHCYCTFGLGCFFNGLGLASSNLKKKHVMVQHTNVPWINDFSQFWCERTWLAHSTLLGWTQTPTVSQTHHPTTVVDLKFLQPRSRTL